MKKTWAFLLLFVTSIAYAAIPWDIPSDEMKFGNGSSATTKSIEMKMGLGASNPIFSSLDGTEMNVNIPLKIQGNLTSEGNLNTLGDGTNVDKSLIFDTGSGANNPFFKWDATAGALTFSNDGTIEKKIGSGDGGGAGGIISLDNPGFEDGITSEWSCSASRCTEETTSPLVGEKSLKFDPAVQNEFFESTIKAIPTGIMGAACEARVFYTGGDENLSAQVLDGNGLVLSEIVLTTHSIASYESLFYLCPNAADIGGDAQKGNLKLKVYNQTVTAAASSTFDEMYKGSLIGLVETTLPDVCSARFTAAGVLVSQKGDCISGDASTTGTGLWDVVYNSGIYTVIPSVNATVSSVASTAVDISLYGMSTSGFSVRMYDQAGAAINKDFEVVIVKHGVDAKQSVQVYKSIPKVSENVNDFSGVIQNNGVVSILSENVNFMASVSRTSTGLGSVTFQPGIFTVIPKIECQPVDVADSSTSAACNITSVSTSGFSWITNRDANDVRSYRDVDFNVSVSKQDSDFKMPTNQIILVNQVQTSDAKGKSIESCRIDNSGTATINNASGICGWVDNVSTVATGRVDVTWKSGSFGGLAPNCQCTTIGGRICEFISGDSGDLVEIRAITKSIADVDTNYDFFIQCEGAR